MSTPSMPKIPSKASIRAKVARYTIEAHARGAHIEKPKPGCPLCGESRKS